MFPKERATQSFKIFLGHFVGAISSISSNEILLKLTGQNNSAHPDTGRAVGCTQARILAWPQSLFLFLSVSKTGNQAVGNCIGPPFFPNEHQVRGNEQEGYLANSFKSLYLKFLCI